MSSEKSLTPQIRFKGFTEAWEQRKLGDVAAFSKGQGFSKSDLTESGSPVILYGRLYTNYETVICKVDTFVKKSSSGVLSKGGEVIIPASGETAEDIAVASYVSLPGILLGGDLNVVTPKYNLDSSFLALFITFGNAHAELSKLAQGKSVVHVHNSDLSQLNVNYPTYPEQTLISNLFIKNDNLITLHQRKLDALKKIKSALLEKMFPKDGSNIPEIRFTGFTEAWEQRKLGELMEVTSVRRVHQDDWTTQGVRFLRARDLVAYANNTEIELPLYISKELYEKYTTQSGKVEIGDLLVTGVGTIGVPWLVETPSPVYFKDGNIIWFKNKNAINGKYFYYAFTSTSIQKFIKESAGTGTVGTYTIDTGKKTPIYIPSTFEQHKIASAMKRFDSLITLHQRKLDALKKIKSALLEKMFV